MNPSRGCAACCTPSAGRAAPHVTGVHEGIVPCRPPRRCSRKPSLDASCLPGMAPRAGVCPNPSTRPQPVPTSRWNVTCYFSGTTGCRKSGEGCEGGPGSGRRFGDPAGAVQALAEGPPWFTPIMTFGAVTGHRGPRERPGGPFMPPGCRGKKQQHQGALQGAWRAPRSFSWPLAPRGGWRLGHRADLVPSHSSCQTGRDSARVCVCLAGRAGHSDHSEQGRPRRPGWGDVPKATRWDRGRAGARAAGDAEEEAEVPRPFLLFPSPCVLSPKRLLSRQLSRRGAASAPATSSLASACAPRPHCSPGSALRGHTPADPEGKGRGPV